MSRLQRIAFSSPLFVNSVVDRVSRCLRRSTSFTLTLVSSYLLLMFLLTHIPLSGSILDRRFLNLQIQGIDKIYHLLSYSLLTFLMIRAFAPISNSDQVLRGKGVAGIMGRADLRRWIYLSLIILGYGMFDELSQPLCGRHRELMDFMADSGGIAVGWVASITHAHWNQGLRKETPVG